MLLVSGSGPKRPFNTLSALESLAAASPAVARDLPIYAAFNPYLSGDALKDEHTRLRAKLLTGRICGVYLQMGTDLAALEAGIDYRRGVLDEVGGGGGGGGGESSISVHGSVFVPTKKLLAQMRFRPWDGVFLSEEYLRDVPAAEAVTAQLLRVYSRRGVVPLIESPVATEEQLAQVTAMLAVSAD